MDLQVEKKDGTLEPFSLNKIISGMMRSGTTQEEAEKAAGQVEAWARDTAVNGVIKTSDVRVKVLEVLEAVNSAAAQAFRSYQKPVQV